MLRVLSVAKSFFFSPDRKTCMIRFDRINVQKGIVIIILFYFLQLMVVYSVDKQQYYEQAIYMLQ